MLRHMLDMECRPLLISSKTSGRGLDGSSVQRSLGILPRPVIYSLDVAQVVTTCACYVAHIYPQIPLSTAVTNELFFIFFCWLKVFIHVQSCNRSLA